MEETWSGRGQNSDVVRRSDPFIHDFLDACNRFAAIVRQGDRSLREVTRS